jgi:hypothetical protein
VIQIFICLNEKLRKNTIFEKTQFLKKIKICWINYILCRLCLYNFSQNYTFNTEIVVGNESHSLSFLKTLKDKNIMKRKSNILNVINFFVKDIIIKVMKFSTNFLFIVQRNSQCNISFNGFDLKKCKIWNFHRHIQ